MLAFRTVTYCTENEETPHRELARHVAQNSRQSGYEEAFSPLQKQDFARALFVAEHTRNPLIQLMLVKDLEAIPPVHTVRWDLLKALSGNRHLSEAVCRKIVVGLGFGGFDPIQRCNSAALLREWLAPGTVPAHYRSTVETRLAELEVKSLSA